MSLDLFTKKHGLREKISMLTCSDFWSACLIEKSPVDAVLVGDSLAMVMHGHESTIPADVDLMSLHIQAVSRGLKNKPIVGDLPFLSYRKSFHDSMKAVEVLMKAGAQALKLEGYAGNEELIRHCVESGVPIMGHLGLTPQSIHQLGGYRVQGRSSLEAERIFSEAQKLQDAGCFSIVLECIPAPLAKEITEKLSIPTIGIGAGAETSGQILVLQDMLGLYGDHQPKFLRKFADLKPVFLEAFQNFHQSVLKKDFPSKEESYE